MNRQAHHQEAALRSSEELRGSVVEVSAPEEVHQSFQMSEVQNIGDSGQIDDVDNDDSSNGSSSRDHDDDSDGDSDGDYVVDVPVGGYDTELFLMSSAELDEVEVICHICTKVLRDAVFANMHCQHEFCNSCKKP